MSLPVNMTTDEGIENPQPKRIKEIQKASIDAIFYVKNFINTG